MRPLTRTRMQQTSIGRREQRKLCPVKAQEGEEGHQVRVPRQARWSSTRVLTPRTRSLAALQLRRWLIHLHHVEGRIAIITSTMIGLWVTVVDRITVTATRSTDTGADTAEMRSSSTRNKQTWQPRPRLTPSAIAAENAATARSSGRRASPRPAAAVLSRAPILSHEPRPKQVSRTRTTSPVDRVYVYSRVARPLLPPIKCPQSTLASDSCPCARPLQLPPVSPPAPAPAPERLTWVAPPSTWLAPLHLRRGRLPLTGQLVSAAGRASATRLGRVTRPERAPVVKRAQRAAMRVLGSQTSSASCSSYEQRGLRLRVQLAAALLISAILTDIDNPFDPLAFEYVCIYSSIELLVECNNMYLFYCVQHGAHTHVISISNEMFRLHAMYQSE